MNSTDKPSLDSFGDLLTVPEVCTWGRWSRQLVYSMIRRKELACVRLGRTIRIPRSALERLMEPTEA